MTQIISEDETYTFEILQEKHLEESSKLLANVFTKYNPIDIFMKMTYEQFYPQALVLSKAVLDEKLKELEWRFIEYHSGLKENDVALIMLVGIREDCCGKGKCSKSFFIFEYAW